ncbi:hypothetical protein BTS2_4110 [Bacillus sp. TS-2]|nr:hypothetical protein BTS2_4110 [Bacillus sp. TS-2]
MELRHKYSVNQLVKMAGLARSSFYHLVQKIHKPDPDKGLKNQIKAIYHAHKGRYGYRRIKEALVQQGFHVNHKKVYRIMRELGLQSIVRIKKYKSYKGTIGKKAPNLLNRHFKADKPNQKWVTDITEFNLLGEKWYVSPILDLYNGEIITYTIGSRPSFSLVSEMLETAFERLKDEDELVLHSDQGWHYQMKPYGHALKERGITQSMSRKGNCYDNAVIENFFGIMKSEFLYLNDFKSIHHFKQELKEYMDYYNNQRIKTKLKGKSPIQYRTLAQQFS